MLRPYQNDLLNRAISSTARNVCVQAPTGSGKTHIMSALAKHHTGMRILFLAHRQEILRQIHNRLKLFGIRSGIIAPWAPRTNDMVQVASVQTLTRREIPQFDIIITDEAHHATSQGYQKIYETINYYKHYGFTATPQRLDGVGLKGTYDELITADAPHWFIREGHLAQYKYFAPIPSKQVKTESMGVRAGDFKIEEAAALFSGSTVHGNIIEEYIKHANGLLTVGFACTVNHAKELSDTFNTNGIPSAVLHGSMLQVDRENTIARFKNGTINVLWTVDVVSEGFDLPECQAVILARPTLSLTIYLQQVGRVLRPKPDGSHAVIIDHALNVAVHGFPCIEREWTLEGNRNKRTKNIKRSCRVCESCGYVNQLQSANCEECNAEFYNPRIVTTRGATMISVSGGESQQSMGQDYNEYIKLLHFAAKKGYKEGWAYHKAIERKFKTLPFKQSRELYAKFRTQVSSRVS